jgi:phospholipase/carboxylesterase
MTELTFQHRYVSGKAGSPTVLALHGTGGTEEDLVPLARELAPEAHVLAPRGRVLEQGMARFFRRLAIGVFDEADVTLRAGELEAFVREAAAHYGFAADRVFALGYSNGANVAAALLLLHPASLAGAALLRPVLPLAPPADPDLKHRPVLIAAGIHDPYSPVPRVEALATILRRAGAEVDLRWQPAGHDLTPADLFGVKEWFAVHLG